MEKAIVVDRIVFSLSLCSMMRLLELQARTKLNPETLIPILKEFEKESLVVVSPFLPTASGEEWDYAMIAPLPRFWRNIGKPNFMEGLRKAA